MTKAQSSNRWRCIRRGISSADREAEKYNDECCWTLSLCVLANGMVKTAYELMLLIFCSSFLLLICCTVVPESISGIHLCQLGDTKKDERKLSEEKSKSELQSTTAFLLTIHFIHSLSAVVIIKARICFFLLTQTTQMVDCVSQLLSLGHLILLPALSAFVSSGQTRQMPLAIALLRPSTLALKADRRQILQFVFTFWAPFPRSRGYLFYSRLPTTRKAEKYPLY